MKKAEYLVVMKEKQPDYWGLEDADRLYHDDKDEAIEAILEDMEPEPETIEICGFVTMEINVKGYDPLEDILERLDEEYGDPDGDPTKPTEAMIEAEKAFLAVIEKEYTSYMCEIVCRETVNVNEWIKEHRPDWRTV